MSVLIVTVLLALAIFGMSGVVGLVDLNGLRVAGARTSVAQRRWALRRIRTGRPADADRVALVGAVAAGRAEGIGLVVTFAGMALTGAALALDPTSWQVLAGVSAGANLMVAVALGSDRARSRRFLGAHPDVQRAAPR